MGCCAALRGRIPRILAMSPMSSACRQGTRNLAAMNLLMLPGHTLFICDTAINPDPTAEQIAEITLLAAKEVRRFGLTPRVALLSHSNFGSADTPSAIKMRQALGLIQEMAPDLEVDGEMHADAALSKHTLDRIMPDSTLTGEANLLIMPNLDAANITFNALKAVAGQGVTVGPILLGAAQPVHILTPTSTVRRIVNMTALTAVDSRCSRATYPWPKPPSRGEIAMQITGGAASAATAPHKKIYHHLYFQVLCAIVLGVLVGLLLSAARREPEVAGRSVHQADQDADRPDHLLHRRPRHRQHGGHEEGRPGRRQGADLLRGHDDPGPDRRADRRQPVAARRRHERRCQRARHQGDRRLHVEGGRAGHHRVHHAHRAKHGGRRLRRGRDPSGAVLRAAVRFRAVQPGGNGQAAAGHHRPDRPRLLQDRRHRDEGRPDRRFRRDGLHDRQVRGRQPGLARPDDACLLRHLPDLRLPGAGRRSPGSPVSASSSSSSTSRKSC